MTGQSPPPLLSLRAVVILLVAVLAGGVVGGLTWWQSHSVPGAYLAALAAFAATLVALPYLVE